MISIVISSVDPQALGLISQNIETTIGVPFEVLAVNNANAARGICEVYNNLAKQARYDIVCFMHEDIQFLTTGWGAYVTRTFQENTKLGVMGIAGCSYKTAAPSGWMCYWDPNLVHQNLMQAYRYKKKEDEHIYSNPTNGSLITVASLDGVWMCTRKELVIANPFDEKLLTGFHGYDIDFCMSVNRTHHCAVTFEVLIKHYSEGRFNKEWVNATLAVTRKWKPMLPFKKVSLTKKQMRGLEIHTCRIFIGQMIEGEYPFKAIAAMIWNLKGAFGIVKAIKMINYARKEFSKAKTLPA